MYNRWKNGQNSNDSDPEKNRDKLKAPLINFNQSTSSKRKIKLTPSEQLLADALLIEDSSEERL